MKNVKVKLRNEDGMFFCPATGWKIIRDQVKTTPGVFSSAVANAIRHGALVLVDGKVQGPELFEGDPTSMVLEDAQRLARKINRHEKRTVIELRDADGNDLSRDAVASQIIDWRNGTLTANDKEEVSIVAGMNVKEAKAIIDACEDEDDLRLILKTDNRSTVVDAVNARLAELGIGSEEEETEEEEE